MREGPFGIEVPRGQSSRKVAPKEASVNFWSAVKTYLPLGSLPHTLDDIDPFDPLTSSQMPSTHPNLLLLHPPLPMIQLTSVMLHQLLSMC